MNQCGRHSGRGATPLLEEVGFLLMPDFSLLCLSAALDALRQANRVAEETLYRWHFFSTDGADVTSSAGVTIACEGTLDGGGRPDLLLVVAGTGAEHFDHRPTLNALRRIARTGCVIGGISLGSYLLARAGLLDGHRCTIHWENLEAFREEFPQLDVSSEVFEVDGERMTCSGGVAALDMMLQHVAEQHGHALAAQTADIFVHERIRDSLEHQRMPLRMRIGVSHPRLLQAVEIIEANTERPFTQDELARRVGLSSRQVERLFRRYLDTTPRQYALAHRLKRARMLLRTTSLCVLDVAMTVGFATASHFTKSYRDHFGVTPTRDRGVVPGRELS